LWFSIFAPQFNFMPETPVRVRFAPSPTGPLHMGGVRTALYNFLFARKQGGTFILRIEDTDQTRYVPGAEEYIAKSLEWVGLTPDEGPWTGGPFAPYRQSERMSIYSDYADALITSGNAYYAFDTAEELEQVRQRASAMKMPNWQYNHLTRGSMKNSLTLPASEVEERISRGDSYVIRLKVPRNEEVRLNDIIRGLVVVNTSNLDDKVLLKSDGLPTYHLANVVDDYLMKISHVIRGEEWLPSAPTHVLLYKYLGWEDFMPRFAHLPLILRPDGNGKLSKRDGDRLGFPVFPLEWTTEQGEVYSGYKEKGYFPEAFVNMLAFLGWNPGDERELFDLPSLIDAFSLERVGKSGARFDADKTNWYNQQYLRATPTSQLSELLLPYLRQKNIFLSEEQIVSLCNMQKDRAVFVKDLLADDFLFHTPTHYSKEEIGKKWSSESVSLILLLAEHLNDLPALTAGAFDAAIHSFLEAHSIGFGKVMPAFRYAVTARSTGASMSEICAFIGKDEMLKRIHLAITALGRD
jgi:glutamyl-tRNA synthetase